MRKLKIGFDASFAYGQKSGTGQYSNQLINGLSKIDKHNKYTIFPFFTYIYNEEFKRYKPRLANNFTIFLNSLSKNIIDVIWRKTKFLRRFYVSKFDIFHSTTFSVPPSFMYKKLIVTIYDVSFYTHPQFHIKENIEHCHKGTVEAIKKADIIIAISENTKKDLINYFDCPKSKIRVTYLGYDKLFDQRVSTNNKKKVMHRYGILKPFIFHLGSLEPRKNTLGLIKAYRLLPKKLQQKYTLIIGGSKGWKNSEIINYVHKYGLEKDVKLVGYIEDKDLPIFYQTAKCFVYPSFYEGFGIPPLEAIASGCPTLVSDISSLPEVFGNAVLYCEPNNIEQIAEKLKLLLSSKNKVLISKGLEQAKSFSWKKTARLTLEIYSKLFNNLLP